MKLKVKRVISSVTFLCILFCSVQRVSYILKDKSSDTIYDTYLEICDDIDVEFLGASRVIWQIYPLNLWDDYGIASYNTAVSGSRPQCWYWIMRETLKYHKPKLLVIDVSLLSKNEQGNNEAMVNQVFDAFPLDYTKIQGALDFKAENIMDHIYNPYNIIFNIRKYHNRWTYLSETDFKQIENKMFNTVRPQDIGTMEFDFETIDRNIVTDRYTISMYYLEECVKLAKENNVELLLIQTPNPHLEESQKIYNWCYVIAEQYGIKYWNMSEDIGYLNLKTDKSTNEYAGGPNEFSECGVNEAGIHLNVSGANKLTSRLAKYIIENYDIEDHRGDPRYDYWGEYLNEWNMVKFEELENQSVLDNYLMLLADNHYNIFVRVNTDIELTSLQKELLGDIGIVSERLAAGTVIFENSMGKEIEYYDVTKQKILSHGDLAYDNETEYIYYQDQAYKLGVREGQELLPDIEFFITHDEDKSLVNYSFFNM